MTQLGDDDRLMLGDLREWLVSLNRYDRRMTVKRIIAMCDDLLERDSLRGRETPEPENELTAVG